MDDHLQSVDGDNGLCRWKVRPLRAGYSVDPADEGDQEPCAPGDLRDSAWNVSRTMIVNRATPPFDNPELRRAMALTLDRQAFIDILSDGQGESVAP
jgi:hypothetical protein